MWFIYICISVFVCRLLDSLLFTWHLKFRSVNFQRPHHYIVNIGKLWFNLIITQRRKLEVWCNQTENFPHPSHLPSRPRLSLLVCHRSGSLILLLSPLPFKSILDKLKTKLFRLTKSCNIESVRHKINKRCVHLRLYMSNRLQFSITY